jgi:hypothetical protein
MRYIAHRFFIIHSSITSFAFVLRNKKWLRLIKNIIINNQNALTTGDDPATIKINKPLYKESY